MNRVQRSRCRWYRPGSVWQNRMAISKISIASGKGSVAAGVKAQG
jgi:hypothetical protein